jgi:hypothetical protein
VLIKLNSIIGSFGMVDMGMLPFIKYFLYDNRGHKAVSRSGNKYIDVGGI